MLPEYTWCIHLQSRRKAERRAEMQISASTFCRKKKKLINVCTGSEEEVDAKS